MDSTTPVKMEYRYLGNSGLRVSLFGYGNWLTSNTEDTYTLTRDAIKKCHDAGINYFDTAEIYGFGNAETMMGRAFKELELRRESIVVSTKLFKIGAGVNDCFLSRKHIIEGTKACLERLQMPYVDVMFCHRPDYETPLEETCRAMNTIIENGSVFYWGTSEWPADRISKAIEICERLNLHKPIVEQPQYNILHRDAFEKEQRRIFDEYKYGSTIWSPLAGGVLSGKYNDGNIPEGSRFDKEKQLQAMFMKKLDSTKLVALGELAKELGFTQAQLAIAWTVANTDVSTCLLGFSRLEQIDENLKALELYYKWNQEIENKVEAIF
jgi:voltage-dependent potassium channel beta subunit